MQTFTSPGEVALDPTDNPIAQLLIAAEDHPNRPALAYKDGNGFVDVSFKEMAETVVELAAGLVALGVEPGDRISLFSSTRMEFTLLDYAIWAAGCATTTIYETSSAEQVEWIVGDSDSVVLICETSAMRELYEQVADSLPLCKKVLVIEEGALDAPRRLGAETPSPTTTWRPSSTHPARPGGPRGASSPTATSRGPPVRWRPGFRSSCMVISASSCSCRSHTSLPASCR
jgi:long-chain acyl-CoA synthetase